MALPWSRLPPAGERIGLDGYRATSHVRDPAQALEEGLEELLGVERVSLLASGREALRVALDHLARKTGRRGVAIPAYTCFSVPAAAVAAGLDVHLVDVTLEGRIDPRALPALPLDRIAALVVCNLFGVPEPLGPLHEALDDAGVALVDDAAQSLGASCAEGPVGGRVELGLLSFGRGKPLCALGGGALAWKLRAHAPERQARPIRPRRIRAMARAAAYDLALSPPVFRALSALPQLGIGETVYDPGFPRGGIDAASLCLAAALLPLLETRRRERAARAEALGQRLLAETGFRPLLAAVGSRGAYPRLGVVAPSAGARDAAVRELADLGASRMYPSSLERIPTLAMHLVGDSSCPGADALAARLLTLPTHPSLTPYRVERTVETLARLTPGGSGAEPIP